MKPRLLKIKGLNSFSQEETIDFLKLTEKGLFGIFGPTGSGKTSVLDAMTLALYDQTARKTNEFINMDINSAHVYFEFEIKNGNEKNIYIAERSYKKTEAAVKKTLVARLCEKKEDNTVSVIAEGTREVNSAVMEIIGLKYDDFTRSVVLPQGKFSEFLTLKGIDRRNMLERIFKLEKYGTYLTEKIYKRFNAEKEILKGVSAKLEFYKEVDRETIKLFKEELKNLVLNTKEVSLKLVEKTEALNNKKYLLGLSEELSMFSQRLESVLKRKDEISKKSELLEISKKADLIFPFVNNIEEIQKEIKLNEEEKLCTDTKFLKADKEAEEVKKDYEASLHLKEERYEPLIKKQEALKQAFLLEEELNSDYSQISLMQKEYKKIKNALEELLKGKNRLSEEKERLDLTLESITAEKKENDTDPLTKDFIEKGAKLEESLLNFLSEKEEAKSKALKLKESKLEASEGIKSLNDELQRENDQLTIKERDFSKFLESIPGTSDDLLKTNDFIGALKNKLLRVCERDKKIFGLNEKIGEFENKLLGLKKETELLSFKISEKNSFLDEIKGQLEIIEKNNMAYRLSAFLKENEACPVCGSIHHPSPAKLVLDEMKTSLEKKAVDLKDEITSFEARLKSNEISIAAIEREKSVLTQSLNEEAKVYFGEKSKDIKKELEALTEKLSLMKKAIDLFENNKLKKEEELNSLKNYIKEKASQKDLLNERKLSIVQRHEEALKILSTMEEKYLSTESELEMHKGKNCGFLSFKEELIKIKQKETAKREAEQKEEKLRKAFEKNSDELKKISEQIQKLEIDLGITENDGKEKRRAISEKEAKINALTNGEKAKKLLEDTALQLKELLEKEKELKIKLEAALEKRETILKKRADIIKKLETLKTLYVSYEMKLKKALEENGLLESFNAFEYILEKEEKIKIENEILSYNIEKNDAENNIQRLKLKLNNVSINKEEIFSLEKEINALTERKEYLSSSIGLKEGNIKDMEEKLKIKEELLKEEKDFNHRCSVLGDLAKLVEGNKFVEFISETQLKYITIEASKRLKKITSGRYAIELIGADFVIRDDFNGGLRRSPYTLSGGEVFLTSFCLALALSTKIQMKNKSPLQFFFLDEGFGTLDSGLLDVVMNALENLHDENLSVGIISHVEAIKDRVPVKLIVEKPDQGFHGSKVRLEYI